MGREQQEAYSSGLDGLARALKNWSDSHAGRREGRRMRFPRMKKKGRSRDACRFTTGQIRVLADRTHIQLPRIGVLKTHESTSKLARRLEQGTARMCPSPEKCSGRSPLAIASRRWLAWTSASATLPCCPPAW